jgi:hypothetical protein
MSFIGLSLPSTRQEDALIGEPADALRDTAVRQGMEAINRAEDVAGRAAGAAVDAAKESLKTENLTE